MNENSNVTFLQDRNRANRPQQRQNVLAGIASLDQGRFRLVEQFVEQILLCHDPDVVRNFMEWRDDPKISSLVEIAAELHDEKRDQLLFAAEELYDETVRINHASRCETA